MRDPQFKYNNIVVVKSQWGGVSSKIYPELELFPASSPGAQLYFGPNTIWLQSSPHRIEKNAQELALEVDPLIIWLQNFQRRKRNPLTAWQGLTYRTRRFTSCGVQTIVIYLQKKAWTLTFRRIMCGKHMLFPTETPDWPLLIYLKACGRRGHVSPVAAVLQCI